MKVVRISKIEKVKHNRGHPTRCLTCKKKDIDFSRYAFYSQNDSVIKIRKMKEGETLELNKNDFSDYIKNLIDYKNKELGLEEIICYVMRFGFCDCGKMKYDLYENTS